MRVCTVGTDYCFQVCVFLCATQATLNLGSVGVIIHGRNCTANAIPTLSLYLTLGCPAGLPFDFE